MVRGMWHLRSESVLSSPPTSSNSPDALNPNTIQLPIPTHNHLIHPIPTHDPLPPQTLPPLDKRPTSRRSILALDLGGTREVIVCIVAERCEEGGGGGGVGVSAGES